MHDKRQANGVQQRDPRIVHARRMHHHAVNRAPRFHAAVDVFLVGVVDHRQRHLIAVARIGFARARNEVRKDRIDHLVLRGHRDDVADGERFAGGQTFGAVIGAVAELIGGKAHAVAGGLGHFWVAVERAAHGCLAKPEVF